MSNDTRGPIERLVATPEFAIYQRHLLDLLSTERERLRTLAEKHASEGSQMSSAAASTQAHALSEITRRIATLTRDLITTERGPQPIALGAEAGYRGV